MIATQSERPNPELSGGLRHATREQAIQRLIVDPIEQSDCGLFDALDECVLAAIAAATISRDARGYFLCVEPEEFWAIVERNAYPAPEIVGRWFLDPAGSGYAFPILRADRATITVADPDGQEWTVAYQIHDRDPGVIYTPRDWRAADPTTPDTENEPTWWAPATPFVEVEAE
jgi:hypothetical protein